MSRGNQGQRNAQGHTGHDDFADVGRRGCAWAHHPKVIEHTSEDVLEVEQGSLYPALHRLEDRGWVSSYWGASENNRKAKFYRLTVAGRKQLVRETSRWRQMTRAIGLVMGEQFNERGGGQ